MFIRDILLKNISENLEDCLYYRNHKTIAYEQGFDEFIERAIEYENNGIIYKVHENVNMYLDVTGKCNGKCLFCIAKTNYKRIEINYKDYISKFENVYKNLKVINPSIQIVGGEPTLWEGLSDLLDCIESLNCRFPVIGTNGTGLWNDNLIDILNESVLEWVNLSRHHYNDKENFEIMGKNVLNNYDLKTITDKLKIPIRLQCNMIGGYIDTYGEVMQMVAYAYQKLNIKNIVFALLTPLPNNSIYQTNIIDYVKLHPINCNSILGIIGKDKRFEFEKYRGGVACYYEVWKYNGYDEPITIVFKYSDNKYLEKADKIENCIPDIIMHTDGKICGSWNRNIKELVFDTS
jgi:organic radical activating enzyme